MYNIITTVLVTFPQDTHLPRKGPVAYINSMFCVPKFLLRGQMTLQGHHLLDLAVPGRN